MKMGINSYHENLCHSLMTSMEMKYSFKMYFAVRSFMWGFSGKIATLSAVTTFSDISCVLMTNVLLQGKSLDTTYKSRILYWDPNILTWAIKFLLSTNFQKLKRSPVFCLTVQ